MRSPLDLFTIPLALLICYACIGETLRFYRTWGKCEDEIISAFWTHESPNCQDQKALFRLSDEQQALCKAAKKRKDESSLACAAGRLWSEGFVVELWRTVLANHYLLGFVVGTFIYVVVHAIVACIQNRGQSEMQREFIGAIKAMNSRPIYTPQLSQDDHHDYDELIEPTKYHLVRK